MSLKRVTKIEQVRADVAASSDKDFGDEALCGALSLVIDLLEGMRDGAASDVAQWAKGALPFFLRWLLSERVATAVLDGLIGALTDWRESRCQ